VTGPENSSVQKLILFMCHIDMAEKEREGGGKEEKVISHVIASVCCII
jgi:hypothetical protein